jgi:thioredoxin reductase (NADPH)
MNIADMQAGPGETPYPEQDAVVLAAGDPARVYDGIIVGGGPAGLSAAIYLARFNRSVLVIDFGEGRSTTHEHNENYLGFPDGVGIRDLRSLGCRQAARFGARFETALVDRAERCRTDGGDAFVAHCGERAWRGRTLIIATGVVDAFPDIPDIEEYVGRSLFWCITCDGWKTRGKRVAVTGASDEAVTTCLQFRNFTRDLTFITNRPAGASADLSAASFRRLHDAGIPLVEGEIACAEGAGGMIRALRLRDGRSIEADVLISQQGSAPNCAIATDLGIELTPHGYIKTDLEQRTNVPRAYAAGDVTKVFAHQVVTAAHEGATAAQAANYDLYAPWQRDD